MTNTWLNLPTDQQKEVAPDEIILPHPRLHERAFVLVPLAEVAPLWIHPVLGVTVEAMLNRLDPAELAAIEAL